MINNIKYIIAFASLSLFAVNLHGQKRLYLPTWNQSTPYNDSCPMAPQTNNRCVTGCVATAMAQIMKYYDYPAQGTGVSTAYSTKKNKIAIPSVSFNTTYDWANMLNSYSGGIPSSTEKSAVAKLMYHCGVSVQMDYDPNESGAFDDSVCKAFPTYFKYDKGISKQMKAHFSNGTAWETMLKNQINADLPIYYFGDENGKNKHAFVCEGYDNTGKFWFNWGWGGTANGYYATSALHPSLTSYKFDNNQGAIIDIKPDSGGTSIASYDMILYKMFAAAPSFAAPNGNFTVTIGLRNVGQATYAGSVLEIWLVDNNDVLIERVGTHALVSALAGAYWNPFPVSCNIPNNVPTGDYKLRVVIYELYVNGRMITKSDGCLSKINFRVDPNIVIGAYASGGGTISPSGNIPITMGSNQTFTFTPNAGEVLEDVLVDDVSQPSAVSAGYYTFLNITTSHTIFARFSDPACSAVTSAQASYTNQTDCMLLNYCWANQSGANSPSNSLWTVWAVGGPGQLTESGMFAFYSRSYSAGSSGQLISPRINTSGGNYTASFWMYRDNVGTYGGQNYQDRVNVYLSTSPSTAGLSPIYTVHRCRDLAPIEGADGWYYYSVSIPTNTISNYVIFEAVGDNGNNIYVDEFYIDKTVPTLKVKPSILNFNATTIDTLSTPQVVTVSGIMTDSFTYNKIGTDTNDFIITETFWDANRGGILSVIFKPSGTGTKTAQILISSDSGLTQMVTLNGIGLDTANFYCAGTGTAQAPYQICNANQLAAFAVHVNTGNTTLGKYYILMNDIDLSGYAAGTGWQPIGNLYSDFQGNFNGNGKVIRNLTINRPTEDFIGLFKFANGATIQNLGIENANVKGKGYVGGLVGDAYGGSTIDSCYATGSVSGSEYYIGGLVGYNYNYSSITNCYASCNVNGYCYVGGLVGYNVVNSIIANSYAAGDVNGGGSWIGGLIGVNNKNCVISNNYAIGNVNGYSWIGGLIGRNEDSCTVTSCYAAGNVSGNAYTVGGLVGENKNSTICNSIAANNSVTAIGTVDRIAGYNDNYNGTCNNNYALNTMVVRNSSGNVSITDGLNTISGMGKIMDTLQSFAFYNTAGNWYNNAAWSINLPSGIWSICDGKWFPFLRWQGIDCDSIFNIIANASVGGTITPIGTTIVFVGKNKTFTFAPNAAYTIDSLLIDGIYTTDSIAGGSYTFANVIGNHTIKVTFKLKPLDFCGGDGTIGCPYEICTAEQLKILADYINAGYGDSTRNKYYKLINNIDLSGYANWEPIGNYSSNSTTTCFQGNFDGDGKAVRNLTIGNSKSYAGLFGSVVAGKVQNLGVENCNITGYEFVGSLMGDNANGSIITNCYATGDVNGDYIVGGLVGINWSGSSITNCYSTCNVSGTSEYVGGIVGLNQDNCTISNCYATGSVSCSNYYWGKVGGLVGANGSNSVISNCYATGNVSGSDDVGGLVGRNSSIIRNCVAANSTVTAAANTTYINRIAGENKNGIYNNNYALNAMAVKNISGNVIITDGLNTEEGMGKDIDTLQSLAFYAASGNWNNNTAWNINPPSGIWKICDGENLPFLRWQRISCADTFAITATAGNNGSISPSGIVNVVDETNQTFTFSANNCYEIDSLWIDGVYASDSITARSYTFNNVSENYTIEVSFKKIEYNITHIADTTCSNMPYAWGNQILTTSGIYYDTLQTAHGCDSVIELTLMVSPISITQIAVSICEGDTYDFHGRLLSTDDIYYDTLQTIFGCDSIIELNLTTASFLFTQISASICEGDVYDFHDTVLTAADIYYDTLQTIFGCDSIIELTLTVNPLPDVPTITKTDNVLTSSTADSYQWYRNGVSILAATFQNYIYTENGKYSVAVSNEFGCTSISEEMDVNDVGIVSATLNNQIRVYPNPAGNQLIVEIAGQARNDGNVIEIYDVVGQTVGAGLKPAPTNAKNEIVIDISHLAAGMYFLKIDNKVVKFVKE